MAEEKRKLEFPIKGHDRCPNCGCEEGIGMAIIERLKEEGELSKDIFPKGLAVQIQLLDTIKLQKALTPTVEIPVITEYYDICAECKTKYVKEIDLTWQPIQIQAMPMVKPPNEQGHGFGFGKGKFPFLKG